MTEKTPINASSLLLATGGGKGITARCVVALATRYRCRFVLLGRSPLEPEPAWAEGVAGEAALKKAAMEALVAEGRKPRPADVSRRVRGVRSGREIRETLAAVAAAGGAAEYLSVNVTDAAAVRAALAPLSDQVTGILHGAGALADKLVGQKSEADFERVVATKVDGLANLLAVIPPGQLHHLILFSSVAGFYGNAGQTDYALANEILNKAAHRFKRQHPEAQVLAVDWGPWDGGMVTPAFKEALAARGIDVIPIDAGTALLADELGSAGDAVQIVVGSPLPRPAPDPAPELREYRIRRKLALEANPFLLDHVIGGQAVLPTVCAVGWIANACEQLYPGYTFFRADDYRALKGIVFDDSLADEYVLDIKEIAKDPEAILFEGVIRSEVAPGKPRYHYSVRITLRREPPEPPTLDAVDLREGRAIAGTDLYTGTTLFHGPAFRGIDRVLDHDAHSLTMRCVLPEVPPETQGQFPVQHFNPFLTDVHLQSLLVWAKQNYGYGGLPLRIRMGELYRPVRFGEETFATLRVRSSSAHSLVADVVAFDAGGRLYSRVEGAEITLSERLNGLFEENRLAGAA